MFMLSFWLSGPALFLPQRKQMHSTQEQVITQQVTAI
jgi:hypothetical protein